MTRWQRFKAWMADDLCDACRNGRMIEYSLSGYALLRIHLRCNSCGHETYITHSPGD